MKSTQIIPVIHMLNFEQVDRNVKLCMNNGVKRVFLINHACDNDELIRTALFVKDSQPDLWVGVNLLGVPTARVISMTELDELDGIWCDQTIDPELYKKFRTFKGQMFGSLAFKYQKQPKDLVQACQDVKLVCDVATTSGPGTGKAIDMEKFNTIVENLGSFPSAIASGVSVNNVELYLGKMDYLLVASSITDRDENVIESKLQELLNKTNHTN